MKTYVYRLHYSEYIYEDMSDFVVKKGIISANTMADATTILTRMYPDAEELFISDAFEEDNDMNPEEWLNHLLRVHNFNGD